MKHNFCERTVSKIGHGGIGYKNHRWGGDMRPKWSCNTPTLKVELKGYEELEPVYTVPLRAHIIIGSRTRGFRRHINDWEHEIKESKELRPGRNHKPSKYTGRRDSKRRELKQNALNLRIAELRDQAVRLNWNLCDYKRRLEMAESGIFMLKRNIQDLQQELRSLPDGSYRDLTELRIEQYSKNLEDAKIWVHQYKIDVVRTQVKIESTESKIESILPRIKNNHR